MNVFAVVIVVVVFLAIVVLFNSLKILDQYQRGVVLTLGRFTRVSGPGLVILIPFIETMRRADLRVQVMPIPSQDVITRDNVSVKVSAVAFFSLVNPQAALLGVGDYVSAIAQLAPIALRANIGKHNLDELLSKQETLNKALGEALEERTKAWGVHIQNVEIRTVDLDPTMIRAMAQEAEAERGARARVITAQGEFQAAAKLAEAADMLSRNPAAMTLRTLATLKEIGAEQNSTIIFPIESLTSPAMSAAAMATAMARLEGSRERTRTPAARAPRPAGGDRPDDDPGDLSR
jgi:regulator of protease activity HflC (stomatin/prohibitin superfamily)